MFFFFFFFFFLYFGRNVSRNHRSREISSYSFVSRYEARACLGKGVAALDDAPPISPHWQHLRRSPRATEEREREESLDGWKRGSSSSRPFADCQFHSRRRPRLSIVLFNSLRRLFFPFPLFFILFFFLEPNWLIQKKERQDKSSLKILRNRLELRCI